MANLGFRPTVSGGKPERLLELHLFDLDRDIYGEDIEVRFLRYLGRSKNSTNVEALAAQIARDVAAGARTRCSPSLPLTRPRESSTTARGQSRRP